jgi:hypothetical protein
MKKRLQWAFLKERYIYIYIYIYINIIYIYIYKKTYPST